jgi:hypothetical protein
MKNHIGKVILFDAIRFNRTRHILKNKLVPALDEFRQAWDQLNIGKFSQDIYEAAASNNLGQLKERYKTSVREELSKMKLPLVSNRMAQFFEGNSLFDSVERTWIRVDAIKAAEASTGVFSSLIDYSFLSYNRARDEWDLLEEDMKKEFSKIITTESQSEAYEQLLQLQVLHNRVKSVLDSTPKKETESIGFKYSIVPKEDDINGPVNSLMYEDNEGKAQINLEGFSFIFNL